MTNKIAVYFLFSMCLLALLSSCSNIKYLKEGEILYVKGKVELQPDTSFPKKYIKPLEENLEGYLRPQPNSSFLGLRPKLFFYNIAGDSVSEKGLKGWLKYKLGEPPVLLSDVNRPYNEDLLRNRLENFGFFNAEVRSDTTIKNKKATVTYFAKPNTNYKIKEVFFELDSTDFGKIIAGSKEKSLLQPGNPYNLDVIISERNRIDNELKEQGYYYFNPDHLLVQVDSTIGNHEVNLYVTVKDEAPDMALHPYYINNIYIFPDYSLQQGDYQLGNPTDSTYRGYHIIDPEHTYRKRAIIRPMSFNKGDLYSRTQHTRSISQLIGMGTFKFVKNNFIPVDSANSNLLDVYYYLTPQPVKSIHFEILGKTASVYNGSDVSVSWLHRNAFKGAEQLRLSVFGGYEFQTGGNVNLNSSFYRYGAEASITFPQIVSPFNWSPTKRFVPHTTIKTRYELLNRTNAYNLNSMTFNFSYAWRESIRKEHALDLLEVAYVRSGGISDEYQLELDQNPNLRHAIEKQFIIGPNYVFTFTNTMEQQRKNTMYLRAGLDLSGNILGLINGANYKEGKVYNFLNAPIAQYVRTEADFRNYTKVGMSSEIAARAMVGFGYAYGNSRAMPYIKQFYVGGPNSLRAFRARTVGPGSYQAESIGEENFIPDMTGDIKIELNAEYRKKLVSIVHGAAFVDVGNIWLVNEDENKPGAKFSKNFLSEMAVGAGVGLRFDLTFLVLRTDLAIPLRIPYLPKGDRWVMDKIDLGDKEWRKNNLIFNLAIGYPF
ncbi:BamA/TamA family outer membrane protein [Albibacterium sp.]|uniref:translocation and assembly module lipoprotein TamL n=1 Tax=Albibacterium sp. TaxID=2952885 RepID=UPI002BC7F20F|nr:BamA/TamA family outer membrane protein [Albibacterium sp.]HUH19476.1 BamA/TamA family outer membrane protein [Albibacterium sp.]